MRVYDATLKSLLQRCASVTMRELTGGTVAKWLDVKPPRAQNLRWDLLGKTVEGALVHIELQSRNDAGMPLRMAACRLGVYRLFGRFPQQIVLYLGEPQLRMEHELRGRDAAFQYRLIDIRTLDGERLLESQDIGDNIIAILAGLRDPKEAVHRIVARIAGLARAKKDIALAQLLILAGLRHLSQTVAQETRKMPIDLDIREHEVLGPIIIEAEQQGRQEGELTIIRRQLEKRFGVLPDWAVTKLAALSPSQLEDLSERVLEAKSLEDVLT
jgi:predicted transposase YdaD